MLKRAGAIAGWILISSGMAFAGDDPGPGPPNPVEPQAESVPLFPVDQTWQDGSNVDRNADTSHKEPKPKSPEECRDRADAKGLEFETADDARKAAIQSEVQDLIRDCAAMGGIGGPPPESAKSGGTTNGGGTSGSDSSGGSCGGGGGGGGESGGGASAPAPAKPVIAHPIIAVVALSAAGADATSTPPLAKGIRILVVRERAAQQTLDSSWTNLRAPAGAPRQNSGPAPALAVAPPAPSVSGTSDLASNGLASADQLEREAAALNAYALSRGRFLSARRVGDKLAMAYEAQLMLSSLGAAEQAAHAAARSRALADRQISSELERQQAIAKSAGGWARAFPKLGKLSASDLQSSVQDELKRASLGTDGLSQYRQDLNSLEPADIDAAIAALRAKVKIDGQSETGPQPPDLRDLQRETRSARELVSLAGVSSE